jgi:hypothetical protein
VEVQHQLDICKQGRPLGQEMVVQSDHMVPQVVAMAVAIPEVPIIMEHAEVVLAEQVATQV